MSYFETSEQNDVIASLEMLELTIIHSADNPNVLKWVVIALHSALQGAMVCHLTDTAGLGALTEKSQRKRRVWYDQGMNGEPPKAFLAGPEDLMNRIIKGMAGSTLSAGQNVSVTEAQKRDFDILHELRNNFVHLQPSSWHIETSGIPRIAKSQLTIIHDIVSAGWAFRRLQEFERTGIKASILRIRTSPVLNSLEV